MKAVLISIHPRWCELIASGQKTIEVRKNKPKMEPPFKCYIYMTAGNASIPNGKGMVRHHSGGQCVIGEFVCNYIGDYWFSEYETDIDEYEDVQLSCLSAKEILEYGDDKTLYFWNISGLVIYDTPRSITEFHQCHQCEYVEGCRNGICRKPLRRPPQSWCYVEEQEGERWKKNID